MRLIYIALGWASGMILAHHGWITAPSTWFMLCVALAVMVAINRTNAPFIWLNVALLAACLGGWRYAIMPQDAGISAFNDTGGLTIVGRVTDAPDVTDTYALLRVDVAQVIRGGLVTQTDGAVLVRAARNTTARYGDTIEATGLLNTPGRIDAFDYGAYLAQRGIYSLLDRAEVNVIASDGGHPIRTMLIDLRQAVKARIDAALPEPQAGFVAAILTGDRRGIAPTLSAAFRDTGAAHLLAISGFNMVIVAGLLYSVLRVAFFGRRWWPIWTACAVILIYGAFTGGAPPVMRAALMSSLLFVAQGFRRQTFVPASIALAVVVISLESPAALWDIGFQLSLCAVLGLAFLVTPLRQVVYGGFSAVMPKGRAANLTTLIEGPIIVTLAAQIAVTPLLLLAFGQISAGFLLVNALVIPVHAYVLAFGWLALVSVLIAPLSQMFFFITLALASWTLGIVQGFAALPLAQVAFYTPPRAVGLVYMASLGVLMLGATRPRWWLNLMRMIRGRRLAAGLLVAACAVLAVLVGAINARPDGRLDVWFLDVGHSHAVLIQTPGGAQILIDGGRAPSRLLSAIGERVPFFDRELEIVMMTSADASANPALMDVFNRYRAGLVLINGQPNLSSLHADLMDAADNATRDGVNVVQAGYRVELSDGVTLEVLHPMTPPTLTDALNDAALVVRVRYGDVSFLITGNASPSAQAAILAGGESPSATVLQLPAHGGRNTMDAAFLQAVAPSAVVVQAERATWRDEPHAGTLALIPDGVPIYRTDRGGTQHFWTDGNTLYTQGNTAD